MEVESMDWIVGVDPGTLFQRTRLIDQLSTVKMSSEIRSVSRVRRYRMKTKKNPTINDLPNPFIPSFQPAHRSHITNTTSTKAFDTKTLEAITPITATLWAWNQHGGTALVINRWFRREEEKKRRIYRSGREQVSYGCSDWSVRLEIELVWFHTLCIDCIREQQCE